MQMDANGTTTVVPCVEQSAEVEDLGSTLKGASGSAPFAMTSPSKSGTKSWVCVRGKNVVRIQPEFFIQRMHF